MILLAAIYTGSEYGGRISSNILWVLAAFVAVGPWALQRWSPRRAARL